MSFKTMIKNDNVTESPVGSTGRTSSIDADNYIDENPQVIEQFRKIVKKMGGKAVARRVIDRMSFNKKVNEATESIESYLRDVGFKIRRVVPGRDGHNSIELYKEDHAAEAFEDLKSAGFLEEFDITYNEGDKYIMYKEV